MEIVNQLELMSNNDPLFQMDETVREHLKLNDSKKRAFNFYISGLTKSIYSDSSECVLYAKRKMTKLNALKSLL